MCELKQLAFTGSDPLETVLLLIEDAEVVKVPMRWLVTMCSNKLLAIH